MITIIDFDPRDNPVFFRPVLACKASKGLSKRVKTSRHLYFKWVFFYNDHDYNGDKKYGVMRVTQPCFAE